MDSDTAHGLKCKNISSAKGVHMKEEVIFITADEHLVKKCNSFLRGRNDSKGRGTVILAVVSNSGTRYEIDWNEEWRTVFPGVQARHVIPNGNQNNVTYQLKIARFACPVHVLCEDWYKYIPDGPGHYEDRRTERWELYEASPDET